MCCEGRDLWQQEEEDREWLQTGEDMETGLLSVSKGSFTRWDRKEKETTRKKEQRGNSVPSE